MNVKQIVYAKIKDPSITDVEKDLAIEETEQAIKNYCNIDQVPEALNFTWANLSVDLIKYQNAVDNPSTDLESVNLSDVSAIKVGDTNISLQGGNAGSERNRTLKSHQANLDLLLMNYREQLNKFRRMVW